MKFNNNAEIAQERLQSEEAEQPEGETAKAGTQEGPVPEPSEADPFGLDQIMQKEDAFK